MADWRRIQGRIRKARTSKDPAGELAALYNDTRDAMVAYELATLHEKTGNHSEAAQWYSTAASRFRRAQWKVKAQEALARLGVEAPLPVVEAEALAERPSGRAIRGTRHAAAAAAAGAASETSSEEEIEATETTGEPDADTQEDEIAETESSEQLDTLPGMQPAQLAGAGDDGKKKRRRRGRRGGVRHRKRREAAEARRRAGAEPEQQSTPPPAEQPGAVVEVVEEIDEPQPTEAQVAAAMAAKHNPQPQRRGRHQRGPRGRFGQQQGQQRGERRQRPPRHERSQPQQARPPQHARPPQPRPPREERREEAPDSTRIGPAAWQERQEKQRPEASGLRAEPALASRLAKLESQLRRLLASTPHPVDDPTAPAGPGVFVLSDTDLIDNYYVEACQTLRIGVGNLLRGGRMKDGASLKSLLASYLGIPEAKVPKYLSEHCSVRWLQLDEGAALLAHFATAVLQPALNILEA